MTQCMWRIRSMAVVFATAIPMVALTALSNVAHAQILFQDDFRGALTWNTSNASVHIRDNEYLVIDSDGTDDDWAEIAISAELVADKSLVIEQRIKLESGGFNYRLPWQGIVFEDSFTLLSTYLPNDPIPGPYGWHFGSWTGSDQHPVPGTGFWESATADYWAITRIILTPSGGELFGKPDDAAKGWFSDEFASVADQTWSHSNVTKLIFRQPWDSVNLVDWIIVTEVDCDGDSDGISCDGDGSGNSGDNPCIGGNTASCDDNCPSDPNLNQADFDSDGAGDICDADIDADGILNGDDVCDFTPIGALVQPDGTLRGDLDGDCDVDLVDFAIVQSEFTGPN